MGIWGYLGLRCFFPHIATDGEIKTRIGILLKKAPLNYNDFAEECRARAVLQLRTARNGPSDTKRVRRPTVKKATVARLKKGVYTNRSHIHKKSAARSTRQWDRHPRTPQLYAIPVT